MKRPERPVPPPIEVRTEGQIGVRPMHFALIAIGLSLVLIGAFLIAMGLVKAFSGVLPNAEEALPAIQKVPENWRLGA